MKTTRKERDVARCRGKIDDLRLARALVHDVDTAVDLLERAAHMILRLQGTS